MTVDTLERTVEVQGVVYHDKIEQGSIEWLKARCGLLTASEMKHILSVDGGGKVTKYLLSGAEPKRLTPVREKAIAAWVGREGTVRELAFAADVSEGVVRGLIKDEILVPIVREVPITFRSNFDDRARSHLYELLSQRITDHVEDTFESWDILRGREDEIEARLRYSQEYAPVTECGFITNDEWGFTLGCSPDGLVGDDGGIEAKSRKQKFQAQTIIEYAAKDTIPPEFMIQVQACLLITKRKWWDFISYSGGMPMVTTRVEPIAEYQEAILEAAREAEAKMADMRVIYDAMLASGARLLPTERSTPQEMHL